MTKTKTIAWMAGIALGASLYGVDSAAAPGDPPPISPCNVPPSASDCGNPDYHALCVANRGTCDTMNKRLALEEQRPRVGGKPPTPNKIYGTPKEPGFADSNRHESYGILPVPYTQDPYRQPKSWNAKMKRRPRLAPRPNTQNRWAAQEMKAKTDALAWTPGGLLATYQRPHAAGGDDVASCEDYVYKGFHDDERWLDAIYGCKGDARCEVNVSLLPASPGIARRALQNPLLPAFKEFIPDYDGRLDFTGRMPKNAFYAGTGAFLTASIVTAFASDPAKQASVQALYKAIRDELSTYDIGQGGKGNGIGPKAQGFADEWDFHEVLNTRTAAITPGEFDEYKRRNDAMLAAMDHFYDVAKCVAHLNPQDCTGIPSAVGRVFPGQAQMSDGDPFASRATFGNVDRTNATDMLSFVNAHAGMLDALKAGANIGGGLAFPGLANRGAVTLGSPLLQAGAAAPPKLNAMSGKAGPPPTTAGGNIVVRSGTRLQQPQSPSVDNGQLAYLDINWRVHPPKIDTSVPYPRLLCAPRASNRKSTPKTVWAASTPAAPEAFVGELAACETVNVLLDEWGKKTAANRGPTCFDTANYACDWSPNMFVKRWVNNTVGYNMAAKERAYAECRTWRTTLFAGRIPARTPVMTKSVIVAAEVKRGKDLEGLPIKQTDNFGQDKRNNETWGSKSFGVGYAYDLGWEAKIFARFPDNDPKYPSVPCRMGGRTHASIEAFAYAFGLPPFHIVAADFGIDLNDDAQQQQTDKVKVYGHGEFLEGLYEFYKIPDNTEFKINQAGNYIIPGNLGGSEETIAVIPVQITWVTLTFTIGIAWGYGADIIVQAGGPDKGTCKKDEIFNIDGIVKPDAHLDLVVGADCSIAGIAGVGVDVDLVLLDIGLPVHGGARLKSSKDAVVSIVFDAGLDLTLGTLDGHMDAYAKFLGIKLFEVELFHWKGFHTKIPIFAFKSREFPLFDLGGAAVNPSPGAATSTAPPDNAAPVN